MKKQMDHWVMTRLFAWLLMLCLLMTCAFADGEWVCPNCGLTMTRKFCTKCRTPSPAPAQDGAPAPSAAPAAAPAPTSSVPKGGIKAMVVKDTSLMEEDLIMPIDLLQEGTPVFVFNSKWDSDGTEWAQVKLLPDSQKGFVLVSALALGATPTPVQTPSPTPAATATPKAKLWTGDPTKKGNIVTFGRYEQDNNKNNGQEPIEWIVLDYDKAKNQATLISKYGLESKQYHNRMPYPTWEKSDIRKWLNGTFLNAAFTAEEQQLIVSRKNTTPSYCGNSGGADTQDKIWLLSRDEAKTYFKSNSERQTIPTAYAVATGALESSSYKLGGQRCCWWWLRSPGLISNSASDVLDGGYLDYALVDFTSRVARPAFILNPGSE